MIDIKFKFCLWLGTIKTTRYQVGRHKHVGDSSEKQAIVWFVDNGRWNLALETDPSGNPIKGKKKGLIKAIRNGSAVRCVTMDGTYAFSAQNLAINKKSTNVAAQTINHISVRRVSFSFIYFFPNLNFILYIIFTKYSLSQVVLC